MEQQPPPSLPSASKGNGAKFWAPNSNRNPQPQGSIPIPIPIANGGVTGYKPYGVEAHFVGVGPYYCHYVQPAQPPLPPQVNTNKGFVENRGKVNVNMVHQELTTLFGQVRRGTGVFHPMRPNVPIKSNNRSTKTRGRKNKQGAEATHHHQSQRNSNTSKSGNGDLAMMEKCHEHSPPSDDIYYLPKEWTYSI